MRTGVSYMGHHNPAHMRTDLREMQQLGLSDLLLAMQENDFVYMTGKLDYLPGLAQEHGLRPIAIFWGVLNIFGGGRSSQFLLEHPECHQVNPDGSWSPAGCYNNPACRNHVKGMVDRAAAKGFQGYFIDEPSPINCYCPSCCDLFSRWYDAALQAADEHQVHAFRHRCVLDYVEVISDHVKANHPHMETSCCLMPCDQGLWREAAAIANLDNLGTDIYWVNSDQDVREMTPLMSELADVCRAQGKLHHEWLQCWLVESGRAERIYQQGRLIVESNPAALYLWAWKGQIGTSEACQDCEAAWRQACRVFQLAREQAGS